MIKYKRIGIFVGHSKLKNGNYTSAIGVKNEYLYNKELGTKLKKWFDEIGQPCDLIICPEGKFVSAKEESNYKLPIANSGKYDLIIELHLNAFNGSGNGAEVLYSSSKGKVVAQRVQNKLKTTFKDRGIKQRTDLYILNKTNPVAVLLESFFCDNKDDCAKADKLGTNGLAKLIAEGVVDSTIKESTNTSTSTTDYKRIVGKIEVLSDTLNVRKDADFDSVVVTTLKKGQKVDVMASKNGLYMIKEGQWCSAGTKYVKFTETKTDVYEVTADTLNIRKGRGTEHAKIGTLNKGDRIAIWSTGKDSKGDNWGSFRYSFSPDVIGYAHMDYLKKI